MKTKTPPETGLCCVYVHHSEGFHQKLRPAYDTAPACQAELTDKQVRTLNGIINRYMGKCNDKNKEKNP